MGMKNLEENRPGSHDMELAWYDRGNVFWQPTCSNRIRRQDTLLREFVALGIVVVQEETQHGIVTRKLVARK